MVIAGFKAAYCETIIQNYLTSLLKGPQLLKANRSGAGYVLLSFTF